MRRFRHIPLSAALACGFSLALLAAGLVRTAAAAPPPGFWAPAVRIEVGGARDSDDVVLRQSGLEFQALALGTVGLGLVAERTRLSDPTAVGNADAWAFRARWRPKPALRLDGELGRVRLSPGGTAALRTNHPQARMRLRWQSSPAGPFGELRMDRRPLLASPALLAQPVDLTELRAAFTAPVSGPFLARARLQYGVLDEALQTNRRTGYELAALVRLAPSAEFGLAYSELGYQRKARSPYSAHRAVRGVELATYGEWEGPGPLSVTLDAGIGRQQVSRHDEPPRAWTGSLRLLAMVSWRMAPGAELGLSYERNDSPLGGNGPVASERWRSESMTLSLRLAPGP